MLFVGNPRRLRLSLTCCIAATLKPNHRFRSENLDNYHRMEKGLYAENASHIPELDVNVGNKVVKERNSCQTPDAFTLLLQ